MSNTNPKAPRILIMAAGTGGHVYPALSTAAYLVEQGWHIDWLGTSNGIEQ
ncbi:MAG TPA: UDP-N-acetylglucosamine--N-acetylmuramyl-(pentapeptide) pyrophosphoryl-undecaprenol N-acetylglucosamine transferase, partial [Oceanospirillaceae bacterium]|nr:UDP-N-acetylglucosamine--N-acetylmuramyl-(pentapeptide) pyrophosphoryl-undecaprenol N-acetylglucosamine transferase [Oceanospirillaceae bacterium]